MVYGMYKKEGGKEAISLRGATTLASHSLNPVPLYHLGLAFASFSYRAHADPVQHCDKEIKGLSSHKRTVIVDRKRRKEVTN